MGLHRGILVARSVHGGLSHLRPPRFAAIQSRPHIYTSVRTRRSVLLQAEQRTHVLRANLASPHRTRPRPRLRPEIPDILQRHASPTRESIVSQLAGSGSWRGPALSFQRASCPRSARRSLIVQIQQAFAMSPFSLFNFPIGGVYPFFAFSTTLLHRGSTVASAPYASCQFHHL